jgi:hypothetical protein
MAQTATVHDNGPSLWLKIASNFYDLAVGEGITGLTPPNTYDSTYDLMKKVAYYTARLAS